MKMDSSKFNISRPTTKVDQEEMDRINEAMAVVLSRMQDTAEEHHTRDSVVYIEAAETAALFMLDLPTPGIARQAADALKNSQLPQLIDQAKAKSFAPQGALPSQPPADVNQPSNNDLAEELQETKAIVRASERMRGELLTAAKLPLSDPSDGRAHHEAVEAIRQLRLDSGPRASAQADPKESPEYKQLKADLDAANAANVTLKDEKQALQTRLDQVNETHVLRTEVLALAKKLQRLEAGKFRSLSAEDQASEDARNALLVIGNPPTQGQQSRPRPRRTA